MTAVKDQISAALDHQRDTNSRALTALRAMLERNRLAQEAVERMSAGDAAATFDRALERLIVAAWKRRDVTKERRAVHQLFCAQINANPELAESLSIVAGVIRQEITEPGQQGREDYERGVCEGHTPKS